MRCRMLTWLFVTGLTTSGLFAGEAQEIFERRILPIARSQQSSCVECHFAGVELKQYILADAASTFAALRAAGLVDLGEPENSKLLTFIARKPAQEDALLAKVRVEELAAFRSWIAASVREPAVSQAPPPTTTVGSPLPVEVVRHARRDRVLQAFVENIWVDIERCENCHSPERNARQVQEHGARVSWISPRDPAGTLALAVEQGIIDVDRPEQSMLLTKPLGLVQHGGHKKFSVGSEADKRFRRFLNDYAAIVQQKYRTARELPLPTDEIVFATGQQLKLTELPAAWGDRLLRVDLYRWEGDAWSPTRVGVADSVVNREQRVWQNLVFGVQSRTPRNPAASEKRLLPEARYQARLYLDRGQPLPRDRDRILGAAEFVGSVEFSGAWKPGYQPPKIVAWTGRKP